MFITVHVIKLYVILMSVLILSDLIPSVILRCIIMQSVLALLLWLPSKSGYLSRARITKRKIVITIYIHKILWVIFSHSLSHPRWDILSLRITGFFERGREY